ARPWRRVCHRATAGGWIRGVLEQYVAGSDTRGRPEGHSYPRLQQLIREISRLEDKHLLLAILFVIMPTVPTGIRFQVSGVSFSVSFT
ncbi:MAG: hypothetical protein PVI17_12865, partial [Syntrophobacterales bacterium]